MSSTVVDVVAGGLLGSVIPFTLLVILPTNLPMVYLGRLVANLLATLRSDSEFDGGLGIKLPCDSANARPGFGDRTHHRLPLG
jgi:hypothetical protein